MSSLLLAFASDGSKARRRTVSRSGREIEVSGNVNDPTFVQKKAIVLPTSRDGFQRANRKSCTRRVRGALLSLSPTKLPFSLSLPRSTFPCAVASRGSPWFPRGRPLLRSRRRACILYDRDVAEKHVETLYVRETKEQKHRRGIMKWAREKIKWGTKEERERRRRRGREGMWRRRTTPRDVYDSGALLLRSMCQCVSRWRPAEVDGLAFGRRRRCSVALGTRSVMEDGVTGRPERRGNDTEHAVAATERTPGVSPPVPRSASPPRSACCPSTTDVTAAPRYHPSDRPPPLPDRTSPQPRRHPRTREGGQER